MRKFFKFIILYGILLFIGSLSNPKFLQVLEWILFSIVGLFGIFAIYLLWNWWSSRAINRFPEETISPVYSEQKEIDSSEEDSFLEAGSHVYTDKKGYLRYTETKELVHREIAYKEIYCSNRDNYNLKFSKYVIHHKDKDKKNNDVSNLQILTREEHEKIHGIKKMNLRKIKISKPKRKGRMFTLNDINKH